MEFPKVSTDFIKKVKKEKSGKLRRILYLTAFVFIVVMFARGDDGLIKIYHFNSKIEDAKQDITRLKVEAEDLNWEIKKLKRDSTYIKLYAAERYGYAKADQTIIQFLPAAEDSTK